MARMLPNGRWSGSGAGAISTLGDAGRVRLKGLSEYQDKLARLGAGMVVNGCVAALASGANLMRSAAVARAPSLQNPDPRRKAGTLRNAIVAMRVGGGARSRAVLHYAVQYVIGIRLLTRGAIGRFKRRTGRQGSENPDDPFYGTILEFGSSERTRHPFLRPAFQASAEPAVKMSFEKLRDFTDAEIRRLGAQP